jgi:hypothetical protein
VGVELSEIARRVDPQEHAGTVLVRRGAVGAEVWGRMTPVARAAVERWRIT